MYQENLVTNTKRNSNQIILLGDKKSCFVERLRSKRLRGCFVEFTEDDQRVREDLGYRDAPNLKLPGEAFHRR